MKLHVNIIEETDNWETLLAKRLFAKLSQMLDILYMT